MAYTKLQNKKSQEDEMAVKEIKLLLPLQFPCLLKLLSQRSSILRLAEVPCLQRCVDFHYW